MRLTCLTLANYGPFQSRRIEFDPTPGRINLLVAPNGAGKSVLRGAFCDLLFSIHPQTKMDFRFGKSGMRLMAEAVGPDGAAFSFGRRKGMGNTLIDAGGAPLDAALLARLLGQTDKTLLERLFALDTERLRDGGDELLASGGAVADALLSAAGGLRQARKLRATLDGARDALAPDRKTQARPFYQALDKFLDARRRLDGAVLKPETREKQQTELAHLHAELHGHTKRAQAASARIAQLERVRRVVGPLRQHDDAAAWLAAHEDAPVLPADIGARLAKADEARHRADLLVGRERQARDEAQIRGAGVVCDLAVLEAADAIDALVTRAGAGAQATRDIPRREAELAAAEQQIAKMLHQLDSALPVARAAEAIPREAVVAEARRLFAEHEKWRADLDRLPGELAAVIGDIAAIEAELARLPEPTDTAAAAREAREIRRAGDPAQRANDAAQNVADHAVKHAAALARIPAWGERAVGLKVQPLAGYERLDAARSAAASALDACAATLAGLARDAAGEQARLAEVAVAGPLPDAEAIAAARARRDGGWQLVFRRAFTPDPPSAAEEAAWAGAVALPLAYERAVTTADDIGDRRNREAERVVLTEEIARRVADLQTRIVEANAIRADAQTARDAALGAWRDALAPLALDAATGIAELRALLAGRDKAIDAQAGLASATAAQAALRRQQADAAGRLAAALGEAAGRDAGDLPGLLALAEQRVEAARKADEVRTRLRDRYDALRRSEADRRAALADAGARWEAVLIAWAGLRDALHRPETEPPAITVALLDQFAKLDTAAQAAATARQRLREMRDEVAHLQTDAAALAARTMQPAQADAVATVDALRRRLAEQRGSAKRRDEIVAQLKRADSELALAQEQQSLCAIELRAVLSVIGADTMVAAEPLVALAVERAGMVEKLHRTGHDLVEHGDGRDRDALRHEVRQFDTDAILGEVVSAQEERDAASREALALAARIATTTAAMEAQARETASVQAAMDQQAAVATLGRVLDDALVLHVAALILEDALAQVDAAGTSALLARIGALFGTLTGGAYERIVAEDHGDGGARLLAVERDFPNEAKAVTDLSDGTRDQLFLALRLAAIEDHVASAPALPFIGDDILQTFDDTRALAAMRALVRMSAHVQVILLSHHPHLLELARALGPEQVHVCAIG